MNALTKGVFVEVVQYAPMASSSLIRRALQDRLLVSCPCRTEQACIRGVGGFSYKTLPNSSLATPINDYE